MDAARRPARKRKRGKRSKPQEKGEIESSKEGSGAPLQVPFPTPRWPISHQQTHSSRPPLRILRGLPVGRSPGGRNAGRPQVLGRRAREQVNRHGARGTGV